MDFPRVSVVIPYYNNARTLRRCLLSFANEQTVTPEEIIVVDDGSAQPAEAITQSLTLNTRLTVLHTEHCGQSGASNIGMRRAQGDVILLSCADIVAVPHLVEIHAKEHADARSKNERRCVLGHIAYAPWLPLTPFLQYLSCDGPQFCYGRISDPENVDGALLYSPNCSIERTALFEVSGYDERFPYGFQDTDLGLRLNALGVRVVYRRAAWAHHDHPNTLRNYCKRNRSIGHYVARMGRRYPHLFHANNIHRSIQTVALHPELLGELIASADRFEALLKGRGLRTLLQREQLFTVYAQATEVAYLEGMLESEDSVAPLIGLDDVTWQRIRRRAGSQSAERVSGVVA